MILGEYVPYGQYSVLVATYTRKLVGPAAGFIFPLSNRFLARNINGYQKL